MKIGKKIILLLFCFVCIAGIIFACKSNAITLEDTINLENLKYAGFRSSSYGIFPFPLPSGWENAIKTINNYFTGSTPTAIWIVGEMADAENQCKLYFPGNENLENISFITGDIHEKFLSHFDKTGIKVFLQVEPGNGDILKLIDLVLTQYGHHKSVIGFGVDVEWYKSDDISRFKKGWGSKVTDEEARAWDERIKSHNLEYRMFLKHWSSKYMPPTYRSDIIFVNDSQDLSSLSLMVSEFKKWAVNYFPNEVWFQIGYESDKSWWGKLDMPITTIAEKLSANVSQIFGIIWVDFTLRDVVDAKTE